MGKNKKLRNGMDQVQNYCPIETENPEKEVPEEFLTSDDFCIVQKKKNKKFLESPNFDKHFQLQTNDENTSKSSSSFWSCKFDGNLNDHLVLKTIEKQSEIGQGSNALENFEVSKELEPHAELPEMQNEQSLSENVKSNIPIHVSMQDDNLEAMTLNKNVPDKNVCCTKKKNKKDCRRNSLNEEVEKLLRELELDDDSFVKPKNKSITHASTFSCSRSSQQISCKDSRNNIDACDSSNSRKTKTSNFEASDMNKSDNLLTGDNLNFGKTSKAKMSENRRERKVSTNQEIVDNLKSNLCEKSSIESSNTQEVFIGESKEKIQKSQNNESDNKRGKRPSKKQLAMIHEALKKAKEEEERVKKESEMKKKMAEEAERIRQERLKQEQEKKEKKKLKLKQRREKMKAEGRLLSKSQKKSRARMEATLAALRQQGIEVPQIGDKKPHGPRLGNCKNFHRKRYDSCQSTQSCDSAIVVSERQKSESLSSQESSGKDSLTDLPSSFDSLDDTALTPESDKGIYSYSEESDSLDDASMNKNAYSKISAARNKEIPMNQSKILDTYCRENEIKYRSPIVCVLGHVDTGKTKLLDYIRKTHVQDSEAGGITQQIGATMIPQDALKDKCKMVKNFSTFKMKIPGLLVIDTPGHESFSNLRSRGSSICDIAVLVVDIMHGLEPQTIESINLLKRGKIPFIVALNKIDRIYGWRSEKDEDIENIVKNQSHSTQMEFKKRCQDIILQFANQCLNASLIYENKDPRSYVSMVPTSAITGDGMGNVLSAIVQLTQSLMSKKLIYSNDLEATVLEVKTIPGLGTTVDVILVNGRLQEGDTIVLAGQEGPIVTQIRSLLMPQPLKELRVKNPYIEYKVIEGAQGVKVTGRDLEKVVAGLPLFVASHHNMIETLKEEINNLLHDTINSIKTSERGVYVQASTLGSLEALLNFLSTAGIPYFNVKIGPVVKKDVMKASIMLEHDIMYAAILAFDVKIERDAQELADSLGVHIFQADIIYHLFDMYINFRDDLLSKRNEEVKRLAVFPCKLKILPDFVFSPRDPIVLGVCVEQGSLRLGTPLCVPTKNILEIGVVSSIEMNNSKINCAKKGDEVCIKIDPKPGEFPKTYGKHFNSEDLIVSRITRQSIDTCKEHFRNELQSSDWHLMVELKKMLHIV